MVLKLVPKNINTKNRCISFFVQPEVGPSMVTVAPQVAMRVRTRARVRRAGPSAQATRRLMGMDTRPRTVAFYGE